MDSDTVKFDRIDIIGNRVSNSQSIGAYISTWSDAETVIQMESLNFQSNVCISVCTYGAMYSSVSLSIKNSTFKQNSSLLNAGLSV